MRAPHSASAAPAAPATRVADLAQVMSSARGDDRATLTRAALVSHTYQNGTAAVAAQSEGAR